ncbi:MAG: hypothetical protein EOO38_19355 [Cytophagaceae bacterium]|nr:MAG: hypothetical protein EOO38_19355 [Cytophagaceae bacterium]
MLDWLTGFYELVSCPENPLRALPRYPGAVKRWAMRRSRGGNEEQIGLQCHTNAPTGFPTTPATRASPAKGRAARGTRKAKQASAWSRLTGSNSAW